MQESGYSNKRRETLHWGSPIEIQTTPYEPHQNKAFHKFISIGVDHTIGLTV